MTAAGDVQLQVLLPIAAPHRRKEYYLFPMYYSTPKSTIPLKQAASKSSWLGRHALPASLTLLQTAGEVSPDRTCRFGICVRSCHPKPGHTVSSQASCAGATSGAGGDSTDWGEEMGDALCLCFRLSPLRLCLCGFGTNCPDLSAASLRCVHVVSWECSRWASGSLHAGGDGYA